MAAPAGTGLWANRNFQLLWASSGSSNFADGIVISAAPLLAAALTRDPVLIAGVVVAQRLPWFLFTLISGVLVDRLDRRTVLARANLVRGGVLAALGVGLAAGWESLAALYAAAFLLGTAETLADNASLAVLPAIVRRDQLEQANGRIFATMSVTNELVGPPVGGFLFAVSSATPFVASGASFAAAGGFIRAVRGDGFRPERPDGATGRSMWHEVGEGLRWYWSNRIIRYCGVWAGAVNFFSAATTGVMVLVAQDRLGLGATGYGLLLAAGAVGGILGGLTAERVINRLGGGGAIFLGNVLAAAGYAGTALTRDAVVVGLMLAIASYASMVGNVIVAALRQAAVPDHLLGRVTSAYRLVALGALPLGGVFGGLVSRHFGILAPFWVGAVALGVMAFALLPIFTNRALAETRG
jgi:MFS family permease